MVTGGGHLEFPHEKLDEKMETVFSQCFRVNVSEKNIIILNLYEKVTE